MIESVGAAPGVPAVVLIGPPAAGKSRVGRRVARILDLPVIDTDKVVAAAHGPIPEIFAEHGEPHFRALERAAVADALRHRAVVSLGGGAVLDPDTQAQLSGLPVVLLTATPDAVAGRLEKSSRPLSASVEAWVALVERRRPVYERLAAAVWDTSTRPIDRIAAEIADWATVRENPDPAGDPA
ncbi:MULTISPECIES: shikimate kinase [unclassified Microcella]|uniref:shikimate kinase n=1 Tax=unclassified Microcella TaxID=2630066 RepID=UPI000AD3231D|nr:MULTISPECIES: shikimate kinase [unclassified Microcella]